MHSRVAAAADRRLPGADRAADDAMLAQGAHRAT